MQTLDEDSPRPVSQLLKKTMRVLIKSPITRKEPEQRHMDMDVLHPKGGQLPMKLSYILEPWQQS